MAEPVDTQRWRLADELFSKALELPADERLDFVREGCADDEELRAEIEYLLRAGVAADRLFDDGADRSVALALAGALDEIDPAGRTASVDRSGTRIGPYRLVERIGRGGMADVYLGERERGGFRQSVAVKIQRRGLDTDEVLARFHTEREILSGLSHPNIARLLDGGATEDGLPYLVMEFVQGRPITAYCEERELSIPDRLDLFVDVSRAVQAAHAQLVVHRDIKPTNVLVTPDGRVKLLDFGIAKLLDPTSWPGEVPRTRTGHRPLTPEYASPEQILGRQITVASDIYQLGLLLHRLLTGRLPFDRTKRGRELENAITGTRPSKPSELVRSTDVTAPLAAEPPQLARRLRGDLDTIILTALRKEPERRYPSAHEMGEDVRRHLRGRPISARQESRAYRAWKFHERNPWVVPAAAVVLLLLGSYVGTLIRHGRALEAERNAARLAATEAEASQEFLVDLFRAADPYSPVPESRRDVRVSEVMEVGVRRARTELVEHPRIQVELLSTIGDVFLGLGEARRSLEVHDLAYDLSRRQFGEESREAALALRGSVGPAVHTERLASGRALEATGVALRALDATRRAFGADHLEALRAETELGSVLHLNHRTLPAVILLSHALEGFRLRPDATAEDRIRALRYLVSPVARLESFGGRSGRELAREYAVELLELAEAAYGPHHVRTADARLMASFSAEPEEGRRLRRLSIPVLRDHLGADHDQLARAYMAHAIGFVHEDRLDSATVNYRAAAETWIRSNRNPYWASMALAGEAQALLASGRPHDAVTSYEEAIDVARSISPATLPARESARRVAYLELGRIWALYRADGPREEILERARASLRTTEGPSGGRAECIAALALAELARPAEAERMARTGLGRYREVYGEIDLTRPDMSPCATLALERPAQAGSLDRPSAADFTPDRRQAP